MDVGWEEAQNEIGFLRHERDRLNAELAALREGRIADGKKIDALIDERDALRAELQDWKDSAAEAGEETP